jgi:hypothetical protein
MRKIALFLLGVIVFSLVAFILSSCGPNFYLKRAERATRKAIELGAKIRVDTVFKEVSFFTPESRMDTVVKYRTLKDTLRIETEKIKWKIRVNEVEKTVFVDGVVKRDTIKVTVPVQVVREVSSGIGIGKLVLWSIVSAVLGGLFLFFLYLKLKDKHENS